MNQEVDTAASDVSLLRGRAASGEGALGVTQATPQTPISFHADAPRRRFSFARMADFLSPGCQSPWRTCERESASAASTSPEDPPAMAAPIIYIDADACPVKDEAERVAVRHGLVIVFVA